MTSCTAAAHAVTTDAAARMEQERGTTCTGAFFFPSTHGLQPSTAHGKVQHPSTVCIRQDHPFVESTTRTDADHHRRCDESTHHDTRMQMQTVERAVERTYQQHAIA